MGCCEVTTPDLIGVPSYQGEDSIAFDRRTALKGILGLAGVMFVSACGPKPVGEATKLRFAFCGQLLCVVPYEVARQRGHFADRFRY
jgi:NitT/TauT family transport system substrate-binding protein